MSEVSMHPDTTERFFNRLAAGADTEMSAGNLERIRACYDAIARGDFSALAKLTTEDVEMHMTGAPSLPVRGQWHGKDIVTAATQSNYAALADQRAELLALTAVGDDVIVFAREQGSVRTNGTPYDIVWSIQYTFRAGLVARIRGLFAPAFSDL